ncbi:hypothetical protein BD413DRAFT_530173, partial [Trametes elegans]
MYMQQHDSVEWLAQHLQQCCRAPHARRRHVKGERCVSRPSRHAYLPIVSVREDGAQRRVAGDDMHPLPAQQIVGARGTAQGSQRQGEVVFNTSHRPEVAGAMHTDMPGTVCGRYATRWRSSSSCTRLRASYCSKAYRHTIGRLSANLSDAKRLRGAEDDA